MCLKVKVIFSFKYQLSRWVTHDKYPGDEYIWTLDISHYNITAVTVWMEFNVHSISFEFTTSYSSDSKLGWVNGITSDCGCLIAVRVLNTSFVYMKCFRDINIIWGKVCWLLGTTGLCRLCGQLAVSVLMYTYTWCLSIITQCTSLNCGRLVVITSVMVVDIHDYIAEYKTIKRFLLLLRISYNNGSHSGIFMMRQPGQSFQHMRVFLLCFSSVSQKKTQP